MSLASELCAVEAGAVGVCCGNGVGNARVVSGDGQGVEALWENGDTTSVFFPFPLPLPALALALALLVHAF